MHQIYAEESFALATTFYFLQWHWSRLHACYVILKQEKILTIFFNAYLISREIVPAADKSEMIDKLPVIDIS